MPELTISAHRNLGPLSVDVVAPGGGLVNQKPLVLSSGARSTILRDLKPGTYVVVATRPTGERLVRQVELGEGQDLSVELERPGSSTEGPLGSEADRGLVPLASGRFDRLPHSPGWSERLLSLSGEGGDNLRALRSSLAGSSIRLTPASFGQGQAPGGRAYRLCAWLLINGEWTDWDGPRHEVLEEYLRLEFPPPDRNVQAYAVALLNNGFGPNVVVPAFRDGLDLTLAADGLIADAAQRVDNPSAVRAPVAVSVPRRADLADLLAALSAGSFPGAIDVYDQTILEVGHPAIALDALLHKRADPAAAVLGAHFLSRYDPERLPLTWLENLCTVLPAVADAPLLLAKQLMRNGQEKSGSTHERITGLLRDAADRPATLYARSRALLVQGLRLYELPLGERGEPNARATMQGKYLNFAADAGGLEAFWGGGLDRPGQRARPDLRPQGAASQTGAVAQGPGYPAGAPTFYVEDHRFMR